MIMSKFKVGDRVRCVTSRHNYITEGRTYVIKAVHDEWYHVITDHGGEDSYLENTFKLVGPNAVLTPEEVFEHLRKGTKLQHRRTASECWDAYTVVNPNFRMITEGQWRIKPEPEVIELNGKRYKLIEE